MTRAPALSCRGLVKRFGRSVAVDHLSFEIAPGTCYGLLGPNGAGKTTTISLVCGLLERDGGEVLIYGEPGDVRSGTIRSHLGYVPQDIALYPELSARENLEFFGRLHGLRGSRLAGRTAEMLELFMLDGRADERIANYSGGMKRRLNVAVGLLHGPDLIVLDEPTVGIDPQSRSLILDQLKSLLSDGVSILYTTHNINEAEAMCDRIGIIDRGKLLAEGTPRELCRSVDSRDRIRLATDGVVGAFVDSCRGVEYVDSCNVVDGRVELLVSDFRPAVPRLLELAERSGVLVTGVDVAETDLEAAFLQLTGTGMRD